MTDKNMDDFQVRLGRIDHIHSIGGGFEADGTLGMFYYNSLRRKQRNPRTLAILVLVSCTLIMLKAGLHVALGDDAYTYRVAQLAQGGYVEQFGSWIMQADPVTTALAEKIRLLIY